MSNAWITPNPPPPPSECDPPDFTPLSAPFQIIMARRLVAVTSSDYRGLSFSINVRRLPLFFPRLLCCVFKNTTRCSPEVLRGSLARTDFLGMRKQRGEMNFSWRDFCIFRFSRRVYSGLSLRLPFGGSTKMSFLTMPRYRTLFSVQTLRRDITKWRGNTLRTPRRSSRPPDAVRIYPLSSYLSLDLRTVLETPAITRRSPLKREYL